MAKAKRKPKPEEPGDTPTLAQLANGLYERTFVTHAESATVTMAHRNRASNIVDKWFDQGWPGFDEGARLAINWCHKCWEARGVIGNLTANLGGQPSGGGNSQYARDIELADDLDDVKKWFHPAHWRVFENTVRWGIPAGMAGAELAKNDGQAIAATRATVGLVANYIAARRGY